METRELRVEDVSLRDRKFGVSGSICSSVSFLKLNINVVAQIELEIFDGGSLRSSQRGLGTGSLSMIGPSRIPSNSYQEGCGNDVIWTTICNYADHM